MSAGTELLDPGRGGAGGGGGAAGREPWRPVDHLEVAARLEASGFGDAAAARGGSVDVFAYAVELELGGARDSLGAPRADAAEERDHPSGSTTTGRCHRPWLEAWGRSVLLLAGAVTCSAAVGSAALPASTLLVAGVVGWVGSQVCAGAAWRRRGLGDDRAAAAVGSWLAVAVVVLVGTVAIGLGSARAAGVWRWRWADWAGPLVVTVWATYAVAAAVLGVVGRTGRVTRVAVSAGAIGAAGVAVGDRTVPALTALVLLCVTIDELRRGLGGPTGVRPRRPNRLDLASARNGGLQAVGLAASLVALLALVPAEQRVVVTIAAMVASASSEPLLVGLGLGFGWLARRGTSWLRARRAIVAVAVLALACLAGVAAALTLVLEPVVGPAGGGDPGPLTATVAAVASSVNGSGVLVQRAGRDRTAMLSALAAGAALLAVARPAPGLGADDPLVTAVVVAVVVGSIVVAARAAAHPSSW